MPNAYYVWCLSFKANKQRVQKILVCDLQASFGGCKLQYCRIWCQVFHHSSSSGSNLVNSSCGCSLPIPIQRQLWFQGRHWWQSSATESSVPPILDQTYLGSQVTSPLARTALALHSLCARLPKLVSVNPRSCLADKSIFGVQVLLVVEFWLWIRGPSWW